MGTVHKPIVNTTIIGNEHGYQEPHRFIIHSTESHDRPGISDITGVLNYLKQTPDELGVHFCIDAQGYLGQGGHPGQLMYGAAGANTGSIHCELIGMAAFIRARWIMRQKQLDKLAKLMAWSSKEFGIPLRWDVNYGFLTHKMATAAFQHGVGHWDPGFGFPTWLVMYKATNYRKNGW